MRIKEIYIATAFILAFLSSPRCINAQADSFYLKNIRDEFKIKWPDNRTVNLVFHGHSVPSGYYTAGNVHKLNAYPHLTIAQIVEKYPYVVVNSITTSVGGEQAEQGETRFANEVLSMRPDVLFIDYALNDRNIGLERAKVAWQKMIDSALAHSFTDYRGNVHSTKVVLLTPTPDTREDILSESSPLAQHAAQIRQLAKDNNVGLIDSYAIFKAIASAESLDSYMAQANHINAKGHQLVADEIAKLFLMEDEVVSNISEQIIADFESAIEITTDFDDSFNIIKNPLVKGINTSDKCGEIKRTSSNWWELIDIPCNFTIPANEVAYLHILVKYPAQPDIIIRPNKMGNEINLRPIEKYTSIGEWQDLVFILEGGTSGMDVNNLRCMFDCGYQNSPSGFVLNNTNNFGYIDELIVNNSAAPRTKSTSMNEVEFSKEFKLNSLNQTIFFNSLEECSRRIEIYDVCGRLLVSKNASSLQFYVPKTGIHIVKIDDITERILVL